MDANGKPIPLRCVLMTISMGVLLVLLFAGPACTHKNRESKFQETSVTVLPSLEPPMLTPPHDRDSTLGLAEKKRHPWPPRFTWLMLSDHAAKTKRKGQEDVKRHHQGPVGAPAPSKHQNHPVNQGLREKKLSQFLKLLMDALLRQKDGDGTSNYKRGPAFPPAKVHIAFTCKTSSDLHVKPGERRELQLYEMSHLDGSFYRGSGLNFTSGRYTAPYTGLYAFFVRLHIDFQKNTSEQLQGLLHMQLCILSLCQENLSLEHIFSYTANEVTATISLNGVLYIQAGQYVSVFLDNKMDSWIILLKGSDFSGVLLGQ